MTAGTISVDPSVGGTTRDDVKKLTTCVKTPVNQAYFSFDSPVSTDDSSSSSHIGKSKVSSPESNNDKSLSHNANSFNLYPVLTDECSSSSCNGNNKSSSVILQNRGKTTYSPSGTDQVRSLDGQTLLSRILSFCNPVTVSTDLLASIKDMIATRWPQVSQEAKRAVPHFAQMYQQVKSYNLPNCLGAKIPIHSGLHVERWVMLLQNYHDNELCHFLAYGWPLSFYAQDLPETVLKNHPSATEFPEHIQKFLATELQFKAIEGPFQASPFTPWSRISPLMTRPKKGSNHRRVIVDLSYPEGADVNTGINTAAYLGRDISYTLPTISDLIAKLQVEGKGAFIWKADLARAYRQLRADSLDAPLLCIKFQGKVFIDKCPPFGCRSSSAACQRVANVLVFLMADKQHHSLAYLDDFSGCSSQIKQAQDAFNHFKHLTEYLGLQLGLQISSKDAWHPTGTRYQEMDNH